MRNARLNINQEEEKQEKFKNDRQNSEFNESDINFLSNDFDEKID